MGALLTMQIGKFEYLLLVILKGKFVGLYHKPFIFCFWKDKNTKKELP
jgi:hypothetical protein